jgi:hypothetical protein
VSPNKQNKLLGSELGNLMCVHPISCSALVFSSSAVAPSCAQQNCLSLLYSQRTDVMYVYVYGAIAHGALQGGRCALKTITRSHCVTATQWFSDIIKVDNNVSQAILPDTHIADIPYSPRSGACFLVSSRPSSDIHTSAPMHSRQRPSMHLRSAKPSTREYSPFFLFSLFL